VGHDARRPRHADLQPDDPQGVREVVAGADLAGANLTEADLGQAILAGAKTGGVTWSSTICPDGTNSDNVNGSCSGHLSTVAFVPPPQSDTGSAASLPFTGFRTWFFVLIGSSLIGLGLLLGELVRFTAGAVTGPNVVDAPTPAITRRPPPPYPFAWG
jgi:Pentapeptide repeats (8 copies)